MEIIKSIDNELKKQFEKLDQVIKEVDFIELLEFKLNEAENKIPWNDIAFQGIYLFEIKNNGSHFSFDEWANSFKSRWEDEKYLRRFTPNLQKMRIGEHKDLNGWIPLYIGKSKNIGNRIREHIYKELEKTTFALKLNARENLQNETFRLKTIKIEVENYDAIVPRIEWQLRNKINPIIGKQ